LQIQKFREEFPLAKDPWIRFVATFFICFKVAKCPQSSLLEVDPSMEILLWTSESANEKDDLLQCFSYWIYGQH
jgi:hypothetical protein